MTRRPSNAPPAGVGLAPFEARLHFDAAHRLWDRAFGPAYPISERALALRLCRRLTLEPGDGIVALRGGDVVGFGIVEVERRADGVPPVGHLLALAVDPAHRGAGIGAALLAALERRLRKAGCRQAIPAGSLHRFWSGVPDDLPGARAFLEVRGYDLSQQVVDLVVPLASFRRRARYAALMRAERVEAVPAAPADTAAMVAFQLREFPGWHPIMAAMIAAGDASNVLLMKRGAEIVGTIMTYTPGSRWRSPNLTWDRLLGADMGGYGAVGIARAWRGRGLGAAMCQEAACHVKSRGGSCCLIDWTHLVDFYARVGASVWRTFRRGEAKTL